MFTIGFSLINFAETTTVKNASAYKTFHVFGNQFSISNSIFIQCIIVAIILAILVIVTSRMKVVPTSGRQAMKGFIDSEENLLFGLRIQSI